MCSGILPFVAIFFIVNLQMVVGALYTNVRFHVARLSPSLELAV
jgi:hypothetical protein